MKSINSIISAALLASAALISGCRADDAPASGEGKLLLSASVSADVTVARSAADEETLAQNCLIWISNSKGLVRRYQGLDKLPADGISLLSGHYIAEAWTGDSVAASFDARYFTGAKEFDITSGGVTQAVLNCRIANTVVEVNYSDEVDNVLSDYTMTVGHGGNDLTFEGRDDLRRGYFMMSSKSKDLTWTFTGTLGNGETYTRTGTIPDARRSTLYTLKVTSAGTDTEVGGAYFSIEVDETAIEIEDEVVIKLAPEIKGVEFDIDSDLRAAPGTLSSASVYISAAAALRDVLLQSEDLIYVAGLSGSEVRLLGITDEYRESLAAKGISYSYNYVADKDVSAMKIDLTEQLISRFGLGRHTFKITATDADGRENSATLNIVIAEGEAAPVSTNTVADADVWAYTAKVTATVNADAASYGFKYRKAGSSEWTGDVAAVRSGNTVSAQLLNLESSTSYEVVAYAGESLAENTATFTTESAAQLPDAGFERTFTNGKVTFFGENLDNLFWDTGNTGSSTMNKNVTTPDTSVKHGGNQSVKLTSQFVGIVGIGKFAAGNIFIGRYLKTAGADGVLGWGRQFTSRPRALRGWIKYRPATVAYENADYAEIKKGDLDKGIVYIALLTDRTEEFEGSSFPVIVKTKASGRQLFDKNDENVIAYGEKVFDAATAGEELIEFTIELSYYSQSIKPSNIMLVAAASKGGDYFVGGPSEMWLDDLELVY